MTKPFRIYNGEIVELTDKEIEDMNFELEQRTIKEAKENKVIEEAKNAEKAIIEAKEQARLSALQKLSQIGLTESEVKSIIG
jgi:hypothetical protein